MRTSVAHGTAAGTHWIERRLRTGTATFGGMTPRDPPAAVRLDKWLWAARFYKTRALAAEAVDLGRVEVNGDTVKRAREVRVGDYLTIRRPPFVQSIVVRGVSEQRGPATVAQALYAESAESLQGRERLAAQLKAAQGYGLHEAGRPSKRDRRAINRFRGRTE